MNIIGTCMIFGILSTVYILVGLIVNDLDTDKFGTHGKLRKMLVTALWPPWVFFS